MKHAQPSSTQLSGKYVVLGSALPNLSQDALDARDESLAQDIEALGLTPIQAVGKVSGVPANSFIVVCPTTDDVTAVHKLSLKYGQESVLYVNPLNTYILHPDGELEPVGNWDVVEPWVPADAVVPAEQEAEPDAEEASTEAVQDVEPDAAQEAEPAITFTMRYGKYSITFDDTKLLRNARTS